MRIAKRALGRIITIYITVMLILILTAGVTANHLLKEKAKDLAEYGIGMKNPALYEQIKREAAKEGVEPWEYVYEHFLLEKYGLSKNPFIMGVQLLLNKGEPLKTQIDKRKERELSLSRATLVTLTVMLSSMALIVVFGVLFGMKLANHPKVLEIVEGITRFFNGLPSWWIGVLLIVIFAVKLSVLPTGGLFTPKPLYGVAYVIDLIKHLVLPIMTLFLVFIWEFMSIVARETQKEMYQPYIQTERAKGIPEKVIYRKHILRNIGIVLSSFTAQKFMEMFTDYLVIDYLFGLMGLGLILKNSFVREIVPVVGVTISFNFYLFFATTLIIATISFAVSLILEFVKGIIDPRVS
ncbi:ABC transporter permease subunit [Thermococcus paralvinellae]|uniref:ABC-type dipeptide/oligopeptide transport system, permease n=1 Tax=Thermococcus paralvinellae TaxID=582419 RepID=W0I720_9EURY|nr:ABC transporter permease [Thermococcus paralvinellae]AHF80208.1 ABC-type dipeptide/oligopeptide transport system, permease [Thermococcus paralvinellae]